VHVSDRGLFISKENICLFLITILQISDKAAASYVDEVASVIAV
jgi:hypothetical protein